MRKTRAEILAELRHRLGQSETTEHLIDWVLETWETRDFLLRLFGRKYTTLIVEAVEWGSSDFWQHDLVLSELPSEDLNSPSLN